MQTRFSRIFCSAWVTCFALFFAGIILFSKNNQFSYHCHGNELEKVRQVIDGKWNLNHPLLLLRTTRAFTAFQPPPTMQQAAVAGRRVSALFAAGAIVALALLARRMAPEDSETVRAFSGWSVGLLLLMNPHLYEAAHYIKEDPAFLVGIAFTLLALHIDWTRGDKFSAGFAGIAVALAASGKHLGWFFFPLALIFIHRKPLRTRRLLSFLGAFVAFWCLVNFPLITDAARAFSRLGVETDQVLTNSLGDMPRVPHAFYLKMAGKIPWPIDMLFLVFAATLIARFKKTTPAEWLLLAFPAGLGVLLSSVPKVRERYFLPISVLLYFGAGIGSILAAAWIAKRLRSDLDQNPDSNPKLVGAMTALVSALLIGLCCWSAAEPLRQVRHGFARDYRKEMRDWIRQNLPARAIIWEDNEVNLPFGKHCQYEDEKPLPQRVLFSYATSHYGSISDLRAKGVTHVAVCSAAFSLYENPAIPQDANFERRREFFKALGVLSDSKITPGLRKEWSRKPGTNTALQPGLCVFRITATPRPAPNSAAPIAEADNLQ